MLARQFPITQLCPDGPILDGQLGEREVSRIPGCKPCADGKRGSADEAELLDIYGRCQGNITTPFDPLQTSPHVGFAAKEVNEDGRVQEYGHA